MINEKCIRPCGDQMQAERERRELREAERAVGLAYPIIIRTLAGDTYTLEDWGHCKDFKLAVHDLASEVGDPSSFVLLDTQGWTEEVPLAPPTPTPSDDDDTDDDDDHPWGMSRVKSRRRYLAKTTSVLTSVERNTSTDGSEAVTVEVDTKYGSTHRTNMVQMLVHRTSGITAGGEGIELTLVYNAAVDGNTVFVVGSMHGATPHSNNTSSVPTPNLGSTSSTSTSSRIPTRQLSLGIESVI